MELRRHNPAETCTDPSHSHPATLATMRDILTAERTPAGSDHAPIPGAFPISAEECKAAAEAPNTDNADLEPSSRQVHPEAAGIQSQQTILKHFNLDRAASISSYSGARTPLSVISRVANPNPRTSGLFPREVYPALHGGWSPKIPRSNLLSLKTPLGQSSGCCSTDLLRQFRKNTALLYPKLPYQGTRLADEVAKWFGETFNAKWHRRQLRCLDPYWA
jgi:hypothetical protein